MPCEFSLPAIVRSVQRSTDAALSAPGGLEEPRGAVQFGGAGRDSRNGVRRCISADPSGPMGTSPWGPTARKVRKLWRLLWPDQRTPDGVVRTPD